MINSICPRIISVVGLVVLCVLCIFGCDKPGPSEAQAVNPAEQPSQNDHRTSQSEKDVVSFEPGLTDEILIANGEWAPYFSEKMSHYGVVSRIVAEAFAMEGIKVRYVFRPWKRGMEESRKAKLHGTMGWGKKEDRLVNFHYSRQPIMVTVSALFHRTDYSFDWQTLADLKEKRICGTVGYFYGAEFEEAEKAGIINIIRGPEDKLNFMKLLNGRTDLVVNDLEVGREIISSNFQPQQAALITHHPREIDRFDCYLLLAKEVQGNVLLLEVFDRGFESLRQSGKIDLYWQESR